MKPRSPQHVWIAVLNIDHFSARSDAIQLLLRDNMRRLVRAAADDSGLDWDRLSARDEGDGLLMVFPTDIPPQRIAGSFVSRLGEGLAEIDGLYHQDAQLRFRMALHHGMAVEDDSGWTGHAAQFASRLADADILDDVMSSPVRVPLSVIVSEEFFGTVVRPGHRSLDPTTYAPFTIDLKEAPDTQVRVHVPGHTAPPGISSRISGSPTTGSTTTGSTTTGSTMTRQAKVILSCLAAFVVAVTTVAAATHRAGPANAPGRTTSATVYSAGASVDEPLRLHGSTDVDFDSGRPWKMVTSSGIPRGDDDLGFFQGMLWAGAENGITDVPTDAPLGRPTCPGATGYTSGALLTELAVGQAYCLRTTRGAHLLLTVVQMPPDTAHHAEYVGLHVYAWE